MGASFLEKINIFYLLGIEGLPKEEEQNFVRKMTQIVMGNGLADALQKEKIPTDIYKKLLEILEEDKESPKATDSIKLQRYIMDNIPNIKEYLYDATNQFKKESFEDQLKNLESKLSAIPEESERSYFQSIINDLRKNISEETEEEFFKNHKLYTDLKVKHKLN